VAADGGEIGYVQEVVGDEGKDVFDGIAVSTSLFQELKYVPSEKVGRIFEGRVELNVGSNDAARSSVSSSRRRASRSKPRRRAWASGCARTSRGAG